MMRTHRNRLQRLTDSMDAMPVRADLGREAHRHFQATGALPEDQRLARAVIHHCKNGVSESEWQDMDFAAQVRSAIHSDRPKDDVMNELYNEAVYGCETIRTAARDVLVILSDMGCDVTEPVFAKMGHELPIPDWGSVGLWFLGIPDCLAIPPYEEQAMRLFERYAALRERVPQGNRRWFDSLVSAVGLFRATGELPDDALVQECVLADGELTGLLRNHQGRGDPELMAAFNAVARAEGEEREAAVVRVQAMAREGRLLGGGG